MVGLTSTLVHCVVRILATIAIAALLYLCFKGARKIFKASQEIFVMWTIAFGHRWMPKSRSLRIQPFFCKTSELDDVSVQECLRFHLEAFSTSESLPRDKLLKVYEKTLHSYSHILLCRERIDGSLRGLMLIGIDRKPSYTLIKIGMMLVHTHYRGGPWMRLACACVVIRELLLHPLTPLYLLGKVSTYKTYLLAARFRECYPRYDQETPENYKKIAQDYVKSINSPEDSFDPETSVLKRRVGVVKEHVAVISSQCLKNPHIKFFNERNPGWREGDQLITISHMTWYNLLDGLLTVSLKQFLHSRKSGDRTPQGISSGNPEARLARKLHSKTRLIRGLSFQDGSAHTYAAKYYSYEYGEDEGREMAQPPTFDRLYSHDDNADFNIDYTF